jgi:hypothetical protein
MDPNPDPLGPETCGSGFGWCVAKLPELYEMFSKLSKKDENSFKVIVNIG